MEYFEGYEQKGVAVGVKEISRGSGILLAISSLPSSYGIGTLGNAAYRFVDLLVDLKQKYWQILPIGPTSFGDSPYQTMSAFAGNPYLIDLDMLVEDGLLDAAEIRSYQWGTDEKGIDYAMLFENRFKVLKKAFSNFDKNNEEFLLFKETHKYWLSDYALFMAIKRAHADESWLSWEADIRMAKPQAVARYRKELADEITFWEFCQFEFFSQWFRLKAYAQSRGIKIIGDVAFYAGLDSADVWSNQKQYLVDENGNPTVVAGAVPDKFSENGQIWGNPIYNWEEMETDGFAWWRHRIEIKAMLFDVIRIDHFLGILKDYTVAADAKDASSGKWLKGPGRKLTDVIDQAAGDTVLLADDFGGHTPIVGAKKLLNKAGWYGMKILIFAFDGDTSNEHLPHNYMDNHSVVYAGTHDNETIVGHFRDKTEYELAYLYEYLNISSKEEIPDALIRSAYSSTADLAIIQMQDVLKLGNEARMNAPSTVGYNWRWRLGAEQLSEERRAWIRNLASVYRR